MIKSLFNYKWYILVILVLIILEPSINSMLNFWLQRMFNSVETGTDKMLLIRLMTMGFLLWILKRVIIYSNGVLKARFICNARQDVKHKMFISFLRMDTANITYDISSGEYISLFTNDISLLETKFYNQVVAVISNIFSIFIMGMSFVALNVQLAVAILAFGIVSMFIPVFFSKMLNKYNLTFSKKISEFTQKMKEYLVAYPTIKNYSIEQAISSKFDNINQEVEDAKFEAEYSLALANNAGQLLSWFMQFIGVGLGIMLVSKGEITIGTVIAAQAFASDLALPLQNIIINVNSIRSVKEIVKKLENTVINKTNEKHNFAISEMTECSHATPCDQYDVIYNDLCLELDGKNIINHFSFNFEYKKKYLIVGANGSGKTTLFKILKKWYSNYSGQVTIGGKDIKDMPIDTISQAVSFLNEDVSMFSGTVKENILLFRNNDQKRFEKSIKAAQVCLDLEREIIDEGRNISSGEQRRIEIARSLIAYVNVLIFDEVVSTLDIETAYDIEQLALNFQDKTVIFISHNFSGKLIEKYDEILVMKNGSLLAHGNYEYLIDNCEYFKKICSIKFKDKTTQ